MPVYRFGDAELDVDRYELRCRQEVARLEKLPMELLTLLVVRQGQLVTRQEIVNALWGKDVFLDSEQGVNTAIRKIRQALNDNPERPVYIQTVVGKGYRLCTSVTILKTANGGVSAVQVEQGPGSIEPTTEKIILAPKRPKGTWLVVGVVAGLMAIVAGGILWKRFRDQSTISGRVTLVVLPFQSFTNQPEQEAFNDGLTDDLITELAGIDTARLAVIARTSAMSYKNKSPKISDVARELGADYVLEGSARREGSQVRITAQLIRSRDQIHVWARHYDRDLRDVLQLQDEISRAIAEEIRVNLPTKRPVPAPIVPGAYIAYLNGRYYWNQRSEPALIKAIGFFRQAIALNDKYAEAYSGLADSYATLAYGGFLSPSESFPLARQAALQALELDPALAEPHTSLAYVHLYYDWDFPAAEEEFRKALQSNPHYVQAHDWYAYYLVAMGRWNEGEDHFKQALEIDPLSIPVRTGLGFELYYHGKYEEAERVLRGILEVSPNYPLAHFWLARTYQEEKKFEAGTAQFEAALHVVKDWPAALGSLGNLYAFAGHREQAQQILQRLKSLQDQRYVSPYVVALVYAGLNDRDAAFRVLDRAIVERSHWLVWIALDPRWINLRGDLRYRELIRRVGVPDLAQPTVASQ